MKSAIYIRVSTNHQIDKDSLPLQRKDMINHSKYVLGIEDYEIFEDAGFSGKNTDRPAFKNMIKRIEQGEFTHLLVWKIDRISRNLIDFCEMYEDLKKYNCTFISKNEQFDSSSAMGEAMLKIILVFAELERKLTAERVIAVMLDRASKGLWNGAPVPLGYSWDEKIKFPVIDPMEAETIKLIYETYKEHESTTVVRNLLNDSGISTKRNGTWSTKTISDIIRNPFYKGTYRYNYRTPGRGKKKKENEWIVLEDNHPAIIENELWETCNEIMDVNANRNGAKFRSSSKTHIFASLMTCGECNGIMYAKQDKPHNDGYIPSIYVCKSRYNQLSCTQKTISEKIVGEFVFNLISNIMQATKINNLQELELQKILLKGEQFKNVKNIKNIEDVLAAINLSDEKAFAAKKQNTKTVSGADLKLKAELNKYNKALERLEELYLYSDAAMATKDYILKKNEINEKIKQVEEKLNNLAGSNDSHNMNFIIDVLTLELSKEVSKGEIDMKSLIINTDRNLLKEFMNAIIDEIIVKDKRILSIAFKNGLIIKFEY